MAGRNLCEWGMVMRIKLSACKLIGRPDAIGRVRGFFGDVEVDVDDTHQLKVEGRLLIGPTFKVGQMIFVISPVACCIKGLYITPQSIRKLEEMGVGRGNHGLVCTVHNSNSRHILSVFFDPPMS